MADDMTHAREAAERINELALPDTDRWRPMETVNDRVTAARAAIIQSVIDAATADLRAECERLRQRLLTAAGDDLCRLTQDEIKQMSAGAVKIPPKEEFLASCERFHAQVAREAGVMTNCLTLAQLIAENERLKRDYVEDTLDLERERDEAREAAREIFNHDNPYDDSAADKYPWLKDGE